MITFSLVSVVLVAVLAINCSLAEMKAGNLLAKRDATANTRLDKMTLKRDVSGNLMCALDIPTVTRHVHSLAQCSGNCVNDGQCLAINYRNVNKQSPVCELFHCTQPLNFTVAQNCRFYMHRFSDCAAVQTAGWVNSGVYTVTAGRQSFPVYCDMEGGGWLVFQRRQDGSVDFYRNWYNYTNGFGDLTGEFWLGNEYLYLLTSSIRSYELRFDMADWNNTNAFAKYSNFKVASSFTNYKMTFNNFNSGDAGDSFSYHNGMMFSTWDADHDRKSYNCASMRLGGYWYNGCSNSNPNGIYELPNATQHQYGNNWYTWRGYFYSLKLMSMKIRPTA